MPFEDSGEAVDLAALLGMERLDAHRYRGRSPAEGTSHVYGGQFLGQAVMAMGQSAPPDMPLHALQAQFIRAGDIQRDLVYTVTSLRDSRNFALMEVSAEQDGHLIFRANGSFHRPEGADERFDAQPDVPPPEALESETDYIARVGRESINSASFSADFFYRLVDRRSATWPHPTDRVATPPAASYWCRFRQPVADEPLLHQALLAYVSDLELMFTSVRPRGFGPRDPTVRAVSLNHVLWFHRPVRADRWFYCDMDSGFAAGNRGLSRGAIYQDGRLTVTAMQEGLFRAAR